MSRIQATARDFVNRVFWIGNVPSTMNRVGSFIGYLLLAAGPLAVGLNVAGLLEEVKPYTPYLLILTAMYLVWCLAIAWDRNAGPIIAVGPPELDANYNFFDVAVKNVGDGEVLARAYAQDLRYANGRRIPRIDQEVELHWRGKYIGDEMRLYGNRLGLLTILHVNHTGLDMPTLCLVIPGETGSYGRYPLVTDEDANSELHFTVRFDFLDADRKVIKTDCIRYSLRPDPTTGIGYRIAPTGFRWRF